MKHHALSAVLLATVAGLTACSAPAPAEAPAEPAAPAAEAAPADATATPTDPAAAPAPADATAPADAATTEGEDDEPHSGGDKAGGDKI